MMEHLESNSFIMLDGDIVAVWDALTNEDKLTKRVKSKDLYELV